MHINKRFFSFVIATIFLFVSWLVFFDELLLSLWIGLLAVITFSWISCRYSLNEIYVNRFSRKKFLEIGYIFDERLEIRNNSKIPKFWIEINDQSELLGKISSRVITGLGANRVNIFQSTVILNKRGFFLLGPTELISSDPFGFFTSTKIFPSKNNLIVFPKISKLNRFPLLPADMTGGASLLLQTTHPTPQAAGVREYSPGDPLSRVHWPTTVRRDKLMVKEFDEDSQSSVWLLLDAQKGKYVRQNEKIEPAYDRNYVSTGKTKEVVLPRDSFEYAVSIAASIAKYFLEKNLTVGFASAGARAVILPPEKGLRQLNKILESLAVVQDVGSTPFELLVEKQSKNISKGSALIFISPYQSQTYENFMETLRRRGFHVLKVVLDNNSFVQNAEKPDGSSINPGGSMIKVSFGDDIGRVLSVN
jgi:uncharacterized protein (DUF58 family)